LETRQEPSQTESTVKPGKMTAHRHLAEVATRLCFRHSVLTRPRPWLCENVLLEAILAGMIPNAICGGSDEALR